MLYSLKFHPKLWLKKEDSFECVAVMDGHENEVIFFFRNDEY